MQPRVTHKAEDYELQSRASKKTIPQDSNEQQRDVLSRLGKSPVLKVPLCPGFEEDCVVLIHVAQFWFHINPEFYVYSSNNLGSGFHVRRSWVYRRCADIAL